MKALISDVDGGQLTLGKVQNSEEYTYQRRFKKGYNISPNIMGKKILVACCTAIQDIVTHADYAESQESWLVMGLIKLVKASNAGRQDASLLQFIAL